ncbi:sugar metabolism enzyme [Nonlabens sp. YIK11]|uniref:NAD(P)H-binding protein n=1 Tax=Nonlabens sp. YIK11 TaxID=1453349 RepID=UPI0006DC934F|nr:NAD(P)H-binding protein [Nonlabens sp. YIK11]KQC34459.1 sugar metabolism enzyme [Nonlabens sp. YIK11]
MSKIIGIMGCGWLGKPLAIRLLKQNFQVKGTTTRISKLEELRDAGIDPYVVDLGETYIDGGIEAFLEGLEVLVVNIPPGLRSNPQSDYAGRIRLLLRNIEAHSSLKKLIYVSTTSVFEDQAGIPIYDEAAKPNAQNSKGKKLIAAEKVIQKANATTTIIRPGGLIGDERHPIKMLAGRKNVSNPAAPVNMTDRDYLINVITSVIVGDLHAPIIHAISEPHESRESYYTKMADTFNVEAPTFEEGNSVGKKIVSTIV